MKANRNKTKMAEKAAKKIVLLAVPALIDDWHRDAPELSFEQFMLGEYIKLKGEKQK